MEKCKKSTKNNTFKTSALAWNEKFELPDGSYSMLDIQDYCEYIIKSMKIKQIIQDQIWNKNWILSQTCNS